MIPLLEQEQEARQKLESMLSNLTAYDSQSLIRTNELGTSLDFSQGIPVFERTLNLFRNLKESNLDNVPGSLLNEIVSLAQQATSTFEQIQSFNPSNEASPASVRDSLVQTVAEQYQSHFRQVAPIIAYSVRKGTDFDRLEREAMEALEQINKSKREHETKTTSLLAETQATLDQVRRAAAEVGVAQHAIHFREEAEAHRRSSKTWLIATGILGGITLLSAGGIASYYAYHVSDLTTGQAIQLAIPKLVIFSLLYFGVVWSGKIYRAQWHNYVVNKHRQNALSTFETFAKAASDEQTKNAVLIQATQSIFTPQNTGFVSHESEGSSSPQILEIVRSVVDRKP